MNKRTPSRFRSQTIAFFTLLLIAISFPLTAPEAQAAEVTLTWDASTDNAVVGYKIHYGTSSGTYQTIIDAGNVTTLTVYSLADGTTYYFAATAYDANGNESGFSTEVTHTTPAACLPPTTPGTMTYPTSSVTGSFEVGWTAVTGATSYVLERSTSSTFSTTTQVYADSAQFYTQTGLASGTYYYRVKAVSTCGESGWRNGAAVTVSLCSAPAAPGSISYPSTSSSGSFTVSWDAVDGAVSYLLERSTSSAFSSPTQAFSGSSTSYSQTGLGSGTYYYRVRALNSCGESGWTTGPAVTVSLCSAPAAPGSISYPSSNNSGSFLVSWGAVNGVTSYVLERSTSSSFSTSTTVYSGNDTSWDETGLDTGTYYYRVKAVGSCGESGWTTGGGVAVTVTMPICTAPTAPGTITYPSISDSGTFTVSWSSVVEATSYVLERSSNSSFSSPTQVYSGSSTSFHQTGLGSGVYYYRVKTLGSCGESLWTSGGSLTVEVCTSPATPGSINYPSSSDTGDFTVGWSQVIGADSYVLERSTSSTFGSASVVYSGSGTSFTQTGVDSGTYYYRVKAVTSCGESGWRTGSALNVAICTAPDPPGQISYSANRKTGVFTISWGASAGAMSYILESSTSSSFASSMVIYQGSSTSYSQNGLPPKNTYYRVKAANACAESDWTMKPLTRNLMELGDPTFDVYAIDFDPIDGSPEHAGLYHNFTDGLYTEIFNHGVNAWGDAPGTVSIGLAEDAWRMVVPDLDQAYPSKSALMGNGAFATPPTEFAFSAWIGNWSNPGEGFPYTVYVGTSSESEGQLQCQASATMASGPQGSTVSLNGWMGTNDGTVDRYLLMEPIQFEGFDASAEELGLRIVVVEGGKRCQAYYQRTGQSWVLIGSGEVLPDEGTIYGWFGEGTDVQLSVEARTADAVALVRNAASADDSGSSGGGGCDLNPGNGFGAEWLMLLLLLAICRWLRDSK
jgi:hypothetical protein